MSDLKSNAENSQSHQEVFFKPDSNFWIYQNNIYEVYPKTKYASNKDSNCGLSANLAICVI